MDKKIQTNAAISYFFLGELFLLAGSNPDFKHAFIRNHSKNAVKIHFTFLILILFYNYYLASFFYIPVPFLPITVHFLIESAFFAFFVFILIKGAYQAYNGTEASEIRIRKDIFQVGEESIEGKLSEKQKMLYIGSNIPFIGIFVASKYPTSVNLYGERISGAFSFIMISLVAFGHSELLSVLSLFYITYLVFTGLMVTTQSKIFYSTLLNKIPDLQTIYVYVKASIYYLADSIKVIFGGKEELKFETSINKVIDKDNKFHELAENYLTGTTLVFSNKLIFIPLLNLIYVPKYFIDKKSRYIVAIVQGIIISLLIIGSYFAKGYINFDFQIFFLFPIILGMANIDSNPFYRIPIIYEIYSLLDKLSFGLFNKMQFLKEKKLEVKEVSFKV